MLVDATYTWQCDECRRLQSVYVQGSQEAGPQYPEEWVLVVTEQGERLLCHDCHEET